VLHSSNMDSNRLDVAEGEWERTLAKAVRTGDVYWCSRVFEMAKEAGWNAVQLSELANMRCGGRVSGAMQTMNACTDMPHVQLDLHTVIQFPLHLTLLSYLMTGWMDAAQSTAAVRGGEREQLEGDGGAYQLWSPQGSPRQREFPRGLGPLWASSPLASPLVCPHQRCRHC
jgi:hypothetical protein